MTNEMVDEAISQLAEQHGEDKESLEERYESLLGEEQEKGVSNPEKRAVRRLSLSVKGGPTQDYEEMRGVVLGVSDPINTSQSAINRARSYIENHGVDGAVKQGLVKRVPDRELPDQLASLTVTRGEGEQETYAVLDSNDNSPTAGEVLPAEDYIRYVHGVVYRSGGEDGQLFSGVLDAEDDGEVPPVPPKFEPVAFEAVWVGQSDRNNTVRLRFQDAAPFEPTDGPGALGVLEDGGFSTPLGEANANNYDRNDIVITRGSVTYMELAPDEGQSRRLSVVDPFAFGDDLSRTVWLPDHIDVNFGEESDVYVVGQVNESNNEYPDSIEALGVYAHPDYRVDRENIDSMADDAGNEEPTEEPSGDGATAAADAGGDGGGTDDEVTEAIATATYSDLQVVAGDVEGVPGSGLSEKDLRSQLLDALGTEELESRLAADEGDEEPEPEPEATADGGEAGGDSGDSGTEDEGDEEWSW